MQIRKVIARNFRGIKSADSVLPKNRFVCLVGPGDSTKTSLLDVIGLVLTPRWNVQFADADFHSCQIEEPIVLRVASVITVVARYWRMRPDVSATAHDAPPNVTSGTHSAQTAYGSVVVSMILGATEESLPEQSRPGYRRLRLPDSEIRILLQKSGDQMTTKNACTSTWKRRRGARSPPPGGARRHPAGSPGRTRIQLLGPARPVGNEFCVLQPEFPELLARRQPWNHGSTTS